MCHKNSANEFVLRLRFRIEDFIGVATLYSIHFTRISCKRPQDSTEQKKNTSMWPLLGLTSTWCFFFDPNKSSSPPLPDSTRAAANNFFFNGIHRKKDTI
jgi:hypothetical protein